MNKLINGKEISEIIKNEIKLEVSYLKTTPCLAVVLIGDNSASEIYVKNKRIACETVGINFILHKLKNSTTEEELLNLIDLLNKDSNITGILVQLPLPKHINQYKISHKISHLKDVDCLNPYNTGLLSEANAIFKPCTPAGCIELLKRSNISLESKNCLIIGRSNIVGKPLIPLLLEENATVTITHSKTENLPNISKSADIIFVAIGKPNFLKKDMIKENSTIIDIGINRLDTGKLCGDCDFENCLEKVAAITPVPGGVGPMTIAMLLKNCLLAYKLQNKL